MTSNDAYLFTDGRYFLQAEQQLDRYEHRSLRYVISLKISWLQELDFDEARASRQALYYYLIKSVMNRTFRCTDSTGVFDQGIWLSFVFIQTAQIIEHTAS